jgi:phage N-6-adenine-methyltransferase
MSEAVTASALQASSIAQLSADERRRLDSLELVIEHGLARFVEVGRALQEIRERRLYKATHGSFEAYCKERWGFRRAHAHRLIQSVRVVQALSPTGDTPASERQARELAPLLSAPDRLRQAWSDAQGEASCSGAPLTANQVRDAVVRRLPADRLSVQQLTGTDRWETPTDLFETLDAEFGFELDVCALPENAKCSRYYTPKEDGLTQPWSGRCWMNPPYDRTLAHWIEKAFRSALDGATVVSLLPVRTETGWWWNYCRHAEIRFIRGRLCFSDAPTSALFASAVVVFGSAAQVVWWEWQPKSKRQRRAK